MGESESGSEEGGELGNHRERRLLEEPRPGLLRLAYCEQCG
jgi:hypothetical protein